MEDGQLRVPSLAIIFHFFALLLGPRFVFGKRMFHIFVLCDLQSDR